MSDFSELLREHRNAKDWTQKELADHLGTNQTQVSQWETGREQFGSWAVGRYFPALQKLFGYPEDLLEWWTERELTRMEETVSQARSFKANAAARHGKKAPVLVKLDRLIEQARAHHAELIALRNELKPLFASAGDAGGDAGDMALPETAPLSPVLGSG
jgi:transcriptional regulator with XRE-family HTH domain